MVTPESFVMSHTQHGYLWVPGPMPGLNEIIEACKRGFGAYATMKKSWGHRVGLLAKMTKLNLVTDGGHFVYVIRESSKRRDKSNVICGAIKIIEDALQEATIMSNDGWKQVLSIQTFVLVDKERPGVSLYVFPTEAPKLDTVVSFDQEKFNARRQLKNRQHEPVRQGNAPHATSIEGHFRPDPSCQEARPRVPGQLGQGRRGEVRRTG